VQDRIRPGGRLAEVDSMWDPRAERSPPYRARLAGAGIGPGTRVGLDGLADLPFTTKQDLWDGYPGASWPSHAPRSCFTTLTKEAMPLLRYRTGDIVALDRSACACGRTLARMSKVTGRRDDMLVIRGVDVDPSGSRAAAEVGAALLERLGLTTDVRVLPAGAPSPGSSWARRSGSPSAPPTTTRCPAGSSPTGCGRSESHVVGRRPTPRRCRCGRWDGTVGGVWQTRQPCTPSSSPMT
jgi:hypothetical protein